MKAEYMYSIKQNNSYNSTPLGTSEEVIFVVRN